MAKKASTKSRSTKTAAERNSSAEIRPASSFSPRKDQVGFLKDFISNPAVKYVAGGIATAVLSKIVSNLATKYPEISRFLSENLDTIEGRLSDFKNNANQDSTVASRH